jgi:hypothetical protein
MSAAADNTLFVVRVVSIKPFRQETSVLVKARKSLEVLAVLRAVETVALTADQVAEHDIPTRPQKDSTHRRAEDDDLAAELDAVDALHPELLPRWIEEAVNHHCPEEIRERVTEQEEEDRDLLLEWADGLEDDELEEDA